MTAQPPRKLPCVRHWLVSGGARRCVQPPQKGPGVGMKWQAHPSIHGCWRVGHARASSRHLAVVGQFSSLGVCSPRGRQEFVGKLTGSCGTAQLRGCVRRSQRGSPSCGRFLLRGFTADLHATSGSARTPGIVTKVLGRSQIQLALTSVKRFEKARTNLRTLHSSCVAFDQTTPLAWALSNEENQLNGDNAYFAEEACAEVSSLEPNLRPVDFGLRVR